MSFVPDTDGFCPGSTVDVVKFGDAAPGTQKELMLSLETKFP